MLIGSVINIHTRKLLKQNTSKVKEHMANNSSHAGLHAFTFSRISTLMHESHTCKRQEEN